MDERTSAFESGMDERTQSLLHGLDERSSAVAQDIEQRAQGLLGGMDERIGAVSGEIASRAKDLIVGLDTVAPAISSEILLRTNQITDGIDERTGNLLDGIDSRANAVAQELETRGSAMTQGLDQRTDALAQGLDQRTEALAQGLDQRAASLLGGLDNRVEDIAAAIEVRSGAITQSIDSGANSLLRGLDNRAGEIAKALEQRTATIAGEIDQRTDRLLEGIDDRTNAIAGAIESRRTDIAGDFDNLSASLLAGLDQRASFISGALDERTSEIVRGVDEKTSVFVEKLDQRATLLAQVVEEKNKALVAALSAETQNSGDALDSKAERLSQILTERAAAINSTLGTGLLETPAQPGGQDGRTEPDAFGARARVERGLGKPSQARRRGDFGARQRCIDPPWRVAPDGGQRCCRTALATGRHERCAAEAAGHHRLAPLHNAGNDHDAGARPFRSGRQGEPRRVAVDAGGAVCTAKDGRHGRRPCLDDFRHCRALRGTRHDAAARHAADRCGAGKSLFHAGGEAARFAHAGDRPCRTHGNDRAHNAVLRRNAAQDHGRGVGKIAQCRRAGLHQEVGTAIDQANMRFAKSVEIMRQAAHDVQRDLEETREQMRRGVLELPDETRESAESMRKVVTDQIAALRELSEIVARSGKNVEPPAPQRLSSNNGQGFGRGRAPEQVVTSLPPLSQPRRDEARAFASRRHRENRPRLLSSVNRPARRCRRAMRPLSVRQPDRQKLPLPRRVAG